jgi:hypothetical protein
MLQLTQNLSRRTFLQRTTQLGLVALLHSKYLGNVRALQDKASLPATAYGAGGYGIGAYPGVATLLYLPIANKGGK